MSYTSRLVPYYEHAGITIFCADCLDILPHVTADVVVTDPPYGMELDTDFSGFNGGKGHKYAPVIGDDVRFDPAPFLVGKRHVFWGAQYYCHSLPEVGGWMVFNKRGDGLPSEICFGDCELAWSDAIQSVRMYSQTWHGVSRWRTEDRHHPTQKPVGLMRWCIEQARHDGTVLDPFMGSGTTLVAAKQLGRKAIGIEIEEKYVEIAIRRLEQEVLPFEHEKPRTEVQGSLLEEVAPGSQALQDQAVRDVRS